MRYSSIHSKHIRLFYFTVGEFFWKQNQIIQTECLSKILTDGFGSNAHFRSANIFLEDLKMTFKVLNSYQSHVFYYLAEYSSSNHVRSTTHWSHSSICPDLPDVWLPTC